MSVLFENKRFSEKSIKVLSQTSQHKNVSQIILEIEEQCKDLESPHKLNTPKLNSQYFSHTQKPVSSHPTPSDGLSSSKTDQTDSSTSFSKLYCMNQKEKVVSRRNKPNLAVVPEAKT